MCSKRTTGSHSGHVRHSAYRYVITIRKRTFPALGSYDVINDALETCNSLCQAKHHSFEF